jgi:uncharacterized membrane protein
VTFAEETHNPLVPPVYDLVWSVVAVLVVVAVVVMVVLVVRRVRRAPGRRHEQRLAELDDLHARGVISDDERRAARAEVLRG